MLLLTRLAEGGCQLPKCGCYGIAGLFLIGALAIVFCQRQATYQPPYRGNYKRDYVVFTYENEQFVEALKIETKDKNGYSYSSRGTFIGDMFYLLAGDGSVESYDLETGILCDSLNL